jgi:acetyl esterase/lipase
MMIRRVTLCVMAVGFVMASAGAQAPALFDRTIDLVFGEVHGTGLLMDIFVPKGDKNDLAIVDIGSGAWFSDRGKLRDHEQAGMYDIFTSKGYTVFAIRPGSRTKYTAPEMVRHIVMGIQWVRSHAAEYSIDPDRLGLIGASAGAHLSLLTLLTTEEELGIAAAGLFFPPTDFLEWGDGEPNFQRIGGILFHGGIAGKTKEEVRAQAERVSPARQPIGDMPPILIYHGDADEVVPLQQSEKMVGLLKEAGQDAELRVKPGGGHPWMTIYEEVALLGEWFDEQIKQTEGS